MSSMDDLIEISGSIENKYVKEWKEQGKKVIGYSCASVPKELLYAAGLLPFRVRALGSGETTTADAYLSRFNCSFCRSCLELGLGSEYDFLDGIVMPNGCDHMRRMFENWRYIKKPPLAHPLMVPHIVTENFISFFIDDLNILKEKIESHFGVSITDDRLRESIGVYNKVGGKLRKLYELRERDKPALTGAEAMSVIIAESSIPPNKYLGFLSDLLKERENNKISGYRARLMLGGSALDDVELVRAMEDVGGLIVTDSLCFGARAFWDAPDDADALAGDYLNRVYKEDYNASVKQDPMDALARKYLNRLTCPRMFGEYSKRIDFIKSAAERANVDGVILEHIKFCDLHGVDNTKLRIDLEKAGIPVLLLELEYGARSDIGRLRTRIQAFLERTGR